MSLIQEALKRHQEEQARKSSQIQPGPQSPPPAPSRLPPAVPAHIAIVESPASAEPPAPGTGDGADRFDKPEPEPAERPRWPARLVAAALLACVLAAGGYGCWILWRGDSQPPPQTGGSSTNPVVSASNHTLAAVQPIPVAETPQDPPATNPPDVVQIQAQIQEPATGNVELVVTPPPVVTQQLPRLPPAIWPVIVVNGVVGRGQKGAAMLNNRVVDIGGTLEGVKLMAIEGQSVQLEYKGELQTLRVGSSTRP